MTYRIYFIILMTIFPNFLFANTQFFQEALNLYENKKFSEAKFKFEQDIAYNPKENYLIFIFQKFLKI